jgi:hypothetical protein
MVPVQGLLKEGHDGVLLPPLLLSETPESLLLPFPLPLPLSFLLGVGQGRGATEGLGVSYGGGRVGCCCCGGCRPPEGAE